MDSFTMRSLVSYEMAPEKKLDRIKMAPKKLEKKRK